MTQTFGPSWTRVLVDGCRELSRPDFPVPPEWILAKLALESGFDPAVLQGRARVVEPTGPNDPRPEIAGSNGKRLSHGSGARGLCQMMPTSRVDRGSRPDLLTLYAVTDPVQQLRDGFALWRRFVGKGLRHRSALYCANLAPARLAIPSYDDDTILYSANIDDEPINDLRGGYTQTFWPRAYRDNAAPFGLDPKADGTAVDERTKKHRGEGRLRMKHLAHGLDVAVRACRARYDAELDAARALMASRGA
jgi:hypothetical protein